MTTRKQIEAERARQQENIEKEKREAWRQQDQQFAEELCRRMNRALQDENFDIFLSRDSLPKLLRLLAATCNFNGAHIGLVAELDAYCNYTIASKSLSVKV